MNSRRLTLRNVVLLVCGLSAAVAGLQAGASNPAAVPALVSEGERQLEDGRSTLDESTLMSAKQIFEQCIGRSKMSFVCYYDLARTESNLEKAKDLQKDKKAAERWLDLAIDNAKRALAIDDGSSDAHALLGDLYGLKIGLGGMFAGMHYGPKADAETQRALALNPDNSIAHEVLGRKYLFAPKMFGGDLAKAVESFQKATTLDPHNDEAFVWLAIAYRKGGDTQKAQAALAEALRLNSRSAFAKRMQESGAELP